MKNDANKSAVVSFLSLFTSFSTLICCALPALLVTLGMGASLAGLVSAAAWITVLSYYKGGVFTGAGIMLALAVFMTWHGRNAPCPADPAAAKHCMSLRKANIVILGFSVIVYAAGFFFAFMAADLLL